MAYNPGGDWPTFQQGYFTYPYVPGQNPATQLPPTGTTLETENYSYYFRLINSKKKKDYIVKMWHDEHSKFKSLAELKIKLMDTFPMDLPASANFQLGYLEPPGSTKRWLVDQRDLKVMYDVFKPGSKINLWSEICIEEDEPPSKKRKMKQKDEDIAVQEDDIFEDLKKKNPTMESPKLRLWAKLIKSGRHESYEVPPQIPLITGGPSTNKPKRENLTDAFAQAASAIVKVLHDKPLSAKTSPAKSSNFSDGLSPMKAANLRRGCLEDLKKLKDLLEDGVLTESEFNLEKQQILRTLKNINK